LNLRRHRLCCALGLLATAGHFSIDTGLAQNIVARTAATLSANPEKLTEKEVSEFIFQSPDLRSTLQRAEARRVADKLEAHVIQFLDGAPWMPFHHTLGISGYEVYFDHPDEMFHSLAIALPFLSRPVAERVKTFLTAQLKQSPPFALDGFDHRTGAARESYDVPAALRVSGRGQARHAFGVYAFWAWCHHTGDADTAKKHWDALKTRMKPLLETDYAFDINRTNDTKCESEKLNGDLAGVMAMARLARMNADPATEKQAIARSVALMELRVNLERVNAHVIERSKTATKSLHNFKLARYCALVPEVGEALHKLSGGCAAARLKSLREERNGWHLAFGDRFIGGENYTNPLNFPRSLFAGAVFLEQLPAGQIVTFIDVPWGKGDFYFIEKCALALWADAGRPWATLP
jgi:hypothetical protein